MNNWLKTDEYKEITYTLEILEYYTSKVKDDIYFWKWAILALHSALQGFMVIGLKDSAGLNILKDDIAEEWLQAYREGGQFPIEKLDTFLNLYKKIKSNRMLMYFHSKKFVPEGTQGQSIKKLNILRNDFMHFIPKGWSLEVSGLPIICMDCIQIIRFLGWSSGNFIWRDENQKNKCNDLLNRIQDNLNFVYQEYN